MKTVQTTPYIKLLKNNRIYAAMMEQVYNVKPATMELLKFCQQPKDYKKLSDQFSAELIRQCIHNQYLVETTEKWRLNAARYAEIETHSLCNWKCLYCPVSLHQREKEIMNISLFQKIINDLVAIEVKYILLNIYNEPTLDPYFTERIHILKNADRKLELCTNGSNLDADKIDLLKKTGVLNQIRFHLPSIKEIEFKRITKSGLLKQVLRNIHNAVDNGLRVILLVNGNREEIRDNLPDIIEEFNKYENVEIIPTQVTDRAGIIKNYYNQAIHIKGNLYGCGHQINCVHIKVNGDLIICCADYFSNYVYGNAAKEEICNGINSQTAKEIRQTVFGERMAEKNYICRSCLNMEFAKIVSRQNRL